MSADLDLDVECAFDVPQISARKHASQRYHTQRCEHFPKETRDLDESDLRRGITLCQSCHRQTRSGPS